MPGYDPSVPVEIDDGAAPSGLSPSIVLAAAAVMVVLVLAVLSLALDGGDTLLTPLPSSWLGVPIVASMALAAGLGFAVGSALPRGLVRRLAVLAVMACTLYFSGETARGLYTLIAFSGEVERDSVELIVTGASGTSVFAMDPALPGRGLALPASEDVVADPPRGSCVTVPVERAASGAVRLASDALVTSDAVGPCGGGFE